MKQALLLLSTLVLPLLRPPLASGDELAEIRARLLEMQGENERLRARVDEQARFIDELASRVERLTAGDETASMSEGIASIDPNDALVMVNQQVQRIWGYDASELLGQKADVLFPEGPEEPRRSLFERYSSETPAEGTEGSALRFETEGKRKDGSIFPIEVSAARTKIGDRSLATVALRDITERKRAEAEITAALAEKEALLKEIHHRVKNNLQVVVSLLHLQSEHVKDRTAHGAFLDSENRVKSMALMHENLYRSKNLSSIHVSDYIQTLARDLTRSYSLTSSGVELAVHVEDLVLGMDSAIHCGLLVNELVSNALKHAFPENRPGSVIVDLREVEDGRYRLIVRDDGVGLPPTLDSRLSDTLGLQLVHTLAEHLEGTVAIRSGPGTEFEIRFRDADAGN